ncbi:hypothetical protein ONE63_011075 [Megalurothrips usitatus]|uniref:Uncharacterized protein n=1 Tax=Megalurothrips usitatus TaxID=439358 RepID=A0AAV7XLU2_9NEOP|nr:hypothetical protein ONE63_011075 [Megalurothrips usitatus]
MTRSRTHAEGRQATKDTRCKPTKTRRPESAKHRAERLEKKRLAEKRRREGLKRDPDYAVRERQRWHARKKAKKVLPISELKPREQAKRRETARNYKRVQRLRARVRQEEDLNDPAVTLESVSDQVTPGVHAASSKQAIAVRKTIHRDKSACYVKLRRQEQKIQALKKEANRWKKKFYRSKDNEAKTAKQVTPRTKVRKLLNGEQVSAKVKGRLVFGEVISSQLRLSYKSTKSFKVKQVFGRMVNGSVIKRYYFKKHFQKNVLPFKPSTKIQSKDPLKCFMLSLQMRQSILWFPEKEEKQARSQAFKKKKGVNQL